MHKNTNQIFRESLIMVQNGEIILGGYLTHRYFRYYHFITKFSYKTVVQSFNQIYNFIKKGRVPS